MSRAKRQYFVQCDVDGFINWSRPYSSYYAALDTTRELNASTNCGPHSVHAQDWISSDDNPGG